MASISSKIEPRHSLRAYAAESSRPLSSMVFIAPLLFVYESGVVLLGPHALRNGADTWLRQFLESLGFGQYFLLPILTCGILLAWHHTRHDRWSLHSDVFVTMFLESMFFALVLFAVAHIQKAMFAPATALAATTAHAASTTGVAASGTVDSVSVVSRLVGYCGAGIYEELLFRLILLPSVAGLLRWCHCSWRMSWTWAIVITSVLFSAAHYQLFTQAGYLFDWYSFLFRFTAGSFFAIVFVSRGFGIAAGAHAFYDILVELM